jgi:DNA-binding PadR family transcriptional regulator
MKYVILKLLRDNPMHGYEVMKALEEHTHGCYKPSPGTVYPTLQWLEDEGLVRSEEVVSKKVYSITEAGEEFLKENKTTVDEIFDRVEETIDGFLDDPMPDVTRLVGKLVSQTYRTTWKVRGDSKKMEIVVDILSRATDELREVRS